MNRKLTLLLPFLLLLGACSQSKIIQTKVGQTEVYEGFEYKAHFTDYLKPEQRKIFQEQYDYIKNNPDKVQPEYTYRYPSGHEMVTSHRLGFAGSGGKYEKYLEYFGRQFVDKHPEDKELIRELKEIDWIQMQYSNIILKNVSNTEMVSKARATKMGIYFFVKTLQDPESQKFLHIHPDAAKKLIEVLSAISLDNPFDIRYQGININQFAKNKPSDWHNHASIESTPFDLFRIWIQAKNFNFQDIKSDYEISSFLWIHDIKPEHLVFKELFTEKYLQLAEKEFDPSLVWGRDGEL